MPSITTGQNATLFHGRKWPTFVVVAGGVFLSTMDSSMVNIALPAIMDSFASPLRVTEWVIMAYLLTVTATLLFWGYVAEIVGKKRVYCGGLVLFAVGALACFRADLLSWLIGARFCQAMGAAMMMATGPALIRASFPTEELGRALGMVGIAVSLGLMSGPFVGGLLLEWYSWRALFLVVVPVALFFAVVAFLVLQVGKKNGTLRQFDWRGSLLWAAALALLTMAVSHASAPGWSRLAFGAVLLAGGLAMLLFFRLERRAAQPLFPLELLPQRFFWTALLCVLLSFTVLFSAILLMPFYLTRLLGFSPMQVGIVMLAIPGAALLIAPLAGNLSDRIGHRLLTTVGLLFSSTGLLALGLLDGQAEPVAIAWRLALVGGGQAMFLSPNSASVLTRVRGGQVATAAALLSTARNLGMLTGVALAGLLFSILFGIWSGGLDMKDAAAMTEKPFLQALQATFFTAALVGLIGSLFSWQRGDSVRR